MIKIEPIIRQKTNKPKNLKISFRGVFLKNKLVLPFSNKVFELKLKKCEFPFI